MKQEIKTQKIDVLKLSLNQTDTNLYTLLDLLQFPYYILGITVEYKYYFHQNHAQEYHNSDIEFIEYKGEDELSFKLLVKKIFEKVPASFYTNPGLKNQLTQEKQVECLAEYIASLNLAYQENHYTHLLKRGEKVMAAISSRAGK